MREKYFFPMMTGAVFLLLTQSLLASDADLAQELSNPIADLITLPIQMNYDQDIGLQDEGSKLQTNIQPVIPFAMNDEWNMITRTILPVTYQEDIFLNSGSQFGLGDLNLSLFASPKSPGPGGLIWGLGAVFLMPTATEPELGGKKWGAGPSGVAVTMHGPWTLGFLVNHVWSFAGDSDRPDISNSFMQPFVAYTWPSAWTLSMQSETTYNWETEQWAVPVNAAVSKLVKIGKLPVSLQAGVGYWLDSPDSGAEGFRFRFQANFVLPK
ncbi:hypothetical protein [Desulfosediminicola flagellatus]|uniref:hypothetical protein n=1 Tax=Desulfosediminicola flagellatus TaxID=2569541 RepID=UPI001C3E2F7B|nr:hypothetical protein [Desulfosediminicola flagellatus]